MFKKIFSNPIGKLFSNGARIKSYLPQVVAMLFLLAFAAFAWQEPTQAPPSGNVATPINVGATNQSKIGGLSLGGVLGLKEQAVTPSFLTDFGKLYFKSDNNLYLLDDKNQEVNIGGPFNLGDSLVLSSNSPDTINSTSYTKVKEIKINIPGDLRIRFNLKGASKTIVLTKYQTCPANCPEPDVTGCGTYDDGENTFPVCIYEYNGYARIYRNGSSIGTERITKTDQTFSEDILSWKRGDLIQIYAKTQNSNHPAAVSKFQIYAENPPTAGEVKDRFGNPVQFVGDVQVKAVSCVMTGNCTVGAGSSLVCGSVVAPQCDSGFQSVSTGVHATSHTWTCGGAYFAPDALGEKYTICVSK